MTEEHQRIIKRIESIKVGELTYNVEVSGLIVDMMDLLGVVKEVESENKKQKKNFAFIIDEARDRQSEAEKGIELMIARGGMSDPRDARRAVIETGKDILASLRGEND